MLLSLSHWQISVVQATHLAEPYHASSTSADTAVTTDGRGEAALELPDLLPDFSAQPIHIRKSSFVAFVLPFVEKENQRIDSLRQKLQRMQASAERTDQEIAWLAVLGRSYHLSTDVTDAAFMPRLLRRIDLLPPSLVLAQAAIESAWGTSRFAQKANNIFGHWCMKPGCGLVPRNRPEFAHYEVRRFESVEQSVHRYFMNLNTNRAYRDLREIRACHRSAGETLSGPVMAGGLVAYSGGGTKYIQLLRDVIRVNAWTALDGGTDRMFTSGCDTVEDRLAPLEIAMLDL